MKDLQAGAAVGEFIEVEDKGVIEEVWSTVFDLVAALHMHYNYSISKLLYYRHVAT